MNDKMALNTYLPTIESKKLNEQAEQKQTQRYREHFDSHRWWGWVETVRRLRSTNWQLQSSRGAVSAAEGI